VEARQEAGEEVIRLLAGLFLASLAIVIGITAARAQERYRQEKEWLRRELDSIEELQ
jgi:hypothetical protein